MNYQKIHDQIIEKAKYEKRKRSDGVYYERHHIIPRCMNGTDDKENIVLLTAREHFIVHKLLCEIYPDNKKLHDAVWCMIHLVNKHHERGYVVSNREYEYLRVRRSKLLSESMKENPTYDFRAQPPEVRRVNAIKANKARQEIGYRHSQETIEKIRKSNQNKVITEEQKTQISTTVSSLWKNPKSVYNTTEYRNKLANAHKKRHTENPAVDIELLTHCLHTETKSFASALRLYNQKSHRPISRPTFDKWRKKL